MPELDLSIHYFGKNRSLNIWGTKIDVNIAIGSELRGLKQFLKDEDFDLIHFHTIWNPILPFQILANSKTLRVATFHDTPKSKLVGKTIMPLAAKMIFPFVDRAISVSESQSKYISRFSNKEISIIPNGISLADYSPDHSKKREHTLLFLSRLEPRKGILHALEVFKNLQPKFPELTLKIAGDGEDRAIAEQYVHTHNLKNVVFLGFVSEREKRHLLQTSEVLLAPSLFGESFGIILLEAMACGLPITGYGNEGYLNVLTKNQKAFFPPPNNTHNLTEAVAKLLSDKKLQEELMYEGLANAKQFDWELVASEIERVYLNLATSLYP